MFLFQSDILIQIKGAYCAKIEPLLSVHPDQLCVERQGGAAGR